MSPLHPFMLLLLAFLALALSWPLPARIFSWAPGVAQWAFDESTFIWNIWYFKHSLIDNLSNPLHSELIYYPLGIDLVLYTYNFFNALIAQPLHVAAGLVFASNATVLLSTILSGYGTFLLVRYLLARGRRMADHRDEEARNTPTPSPGHVILPALLAGLLYAFASNRAIYATLGHYDMVTTQWIPLYALMLLRSLDGTLTLNRRRHAAVLAGLFFAFNGLAEMITAVFLAIFTVIVVLMHLGRVAGGRWQVADGRWQVAGGRWQMAGGRWQHPEGTRGGWWVVAGGREGGGGARYVMRVLVPALAVTGVVAFILWSPVLIPILVQFLTDDFSLQGWGEAIPLSTDLLGWFTPTVLHPVFGGDLVQTLRTVQVNWTLPGDMATGFRDVNTVFLGWVSAALALLGAWIYRRQVAIWIWTALIFGVFTLGPFLQINGRYRFDLDGVETSFPLPYALLHYIPVVKANRAPNRNSVVLMLGVAVLAGYAVYWLLGLGHSKWRAQANPREPAANIHHYGHVALTLLLACAILFEHLALPLPLSDARVPAVYEMIAADPRPVSVMHAPLGWRNSFRVVGAERTLLQYYQSVHNKPMLGGNISRSPDFKMAYFERIPLFQAIEAVETGAEPAPELAEAAMEQAAELVYLYNTGYVLLMPPIPQRFPYADTWQATWNFFKETLPLEAEPFWAGDGIEAYRVVQPAGADRFELALGTADSFPYRAEGWDTAAADTPYGRPATWATAGESCLFLPLRGVAAGADYRVAVQMRPFDYPGSPQQTVHIRVNGAPFATVELVDDWQTRTWVVPGSVLRNTINEVCLAWGYTAVPRQVLGGERPIGTTGLALPLDAELNSFADGAFISLFAEETGEPIDASAGRRGVNITILDPSRGGILAMEGFDTAANAYESEKLAVFLAQIQPGQLVLVASRGEAGAFLTEEAVAGLRSLGADVTLAQLRDSYFSIAGVKGAAPGTAALEVGEEGAYLQFRLNSDDRRRLAAAVESVEIARVASD